MSERAVVLREESPDVEVTATETKKRSAVRVYDKVSGKKRALGDVTSSVEEKVAKRPKLALIAASEDKIGTFNEKIGVTRTSNLKAPTMQLSGHNGAVLCSVFSPCGAHLASGGIDRALLLWFVYGDCENHTALRGHKSAILQVAWGATAETVYTASADKTGALWDVEFGVRVRQFKGHAGAVHSIAPSRKGAVTMVATGSDDGACSLYDLRMRKSLKKFDAMYQCTSVCLDDNATRLYTGGIDNVVKVWDTRKSDHPILMLGSDAESAHLDTITSLQLNSDNTKLLSNAMDSTLRIWDVQPYATASAAATTSTMEAHSSTTSKEEGRLLKVLKGARHGTEKLLIRAHWSADSRHVVCGSADKCAYVFDAESGECLYRLPGHKGSCNEVDYHPKEPIIVSGSSDKTLFLGEL